jgi:hypothetical protein
MVIIPTLHLYSHAAASLGFAAMLGDAWVMGLWPPTWRAYHISILEMYPIVLALELWGKRLANMCVVFHCDNSAVVDIINTQTASDTVMMCLVRRFVITCMFYNIVFRANTFPAI